MKIMIFGVDGMLGHKMFQILSEHFGDDEVCGTTRSGLELPGKIGSLRLFAQDVSVDYRDILRSWEPEIVVNCTGILKGFHPHAGDTYRCLMVNSVFPQQVARLIGEWCGRLITFSSDCVFEGTKGWYNEKNLPDSPSLYGRTKRLGEVVNRENTLTIRTSLIGREIKSFKMLLEWFLSNNGGKVNGFNRAMWSGVSTIELAKLTITLIEKFPKLHGLYHVTSQAHISKYELLKRLRIAYDLNIDITPDDRFIPDTVCDRSLNGEKFVAATDYSRRSWKDMAAELAEDITPYDSWR